MSGIGLAHGPNVAHLVERDFKEDEELLSKEKAMEAVLVEEVRHNLEIVIMVLAQVSFLKNILSYKNTR